MLKFLSLTCLCWIISGAFAAPIEQLYDVRSLSLKNGLVQSSVRGVLQDKDGLVWLGTEAGVQRFDGLHLKSLAQLVEVGADHMLDTIWIYHIEQLQSGHIIFATRRNGLLRFTPENRTIEQFSPAGFVSQLTDKSAFFETCEDQNTQLYAASSAGLLKLDQLTGRWRVLIGPEQGRFSEVACRSEWVYARQGSSLVRWHKINGQSDSFAIDAIDDNTDSLHIEILSADQVLVAKQDGLFQINQDFTALLPIWPNTADKSSSLNPSQTAFTHILKEDEQHIWLSTAYQGLLLFSLEKRRVIKRIYSDKDNQYSLSGNHVLRVMKDHSGLLWASIYGSGIDRLQINQTAMRTFYTPSDNPLEDNDITAISSGPGDTLWFATNRTGIKRLSLTNMTTTRFNEKINAIYQQYVPDQLPYISDIAVDSLNRLWFTSNAGIVRVSLTTFNSKFYPSSKDNLNGPRVRGRDIFINEKGTLYVTDRGAILRYEPNSDSFSRLPVADQTIQDAKERLWGIRANNQGKLYVLGTENLYVLNDSQLHPLLDPSLLENAFGGRMSALAINKNGDIYIAAQGALIAINMAQPDQPEVNIYSGKQLPDNYFYSVELDLNGDPWLSTNNGIVHFNAQDHSYQHFSLTDGILVREFNGRASFARPNGHVIFGGIDGWSVIAPEQMVPNKFSPRLILSSYQIGSHPIKTTMPNQGIEMMHSDHWLHFSFSALDYRSPQDNQYAYFLEGFDPDWRNFGNKPEISYTGLPPGKYTLHARAAIKRGQWHPEPLKFSLVIHPPFYRSTLAYAIYLLLVVMLFALAIWRRNKLTQERQHYIELIETSRERMRLALWGSGDSIWDWHILEDKIFRTNIPFLGEDNEETVSNIEAFKSLIHPDDLAEFERELDDVLACHTAEYTAQFRMKDKQGNWHWVADQGKVVETTAGNKPVRLSGALKDISELKYHEQQLQTLNDELERKIEERTKQYIDKNEQLSDTLGTLKNTQDQLVESEKMASLGNLVAGISHEINTPVGVALTAASHNSLTIEQLQELFVERKLTVKDMEKGLSQLKSSNDLIESSINRTAQLIQTFKQVAVDHNHHEWRIIEMPAYLVEITPTFNSHLANKQIQIDVIDSEFFDVECSPGDIYQILSQLISNSIDHGFSASESGKITLETEPFEDHWILRYHDNGSGVLNDTLEHIFEPFYTTKRGSGYAGLGMHLVYNIVSHSLGGTIECSSEPGQGITFSIKLPLSKPDRPEPILLHSLLHTKTSKI